MPGSATAAGLAAETAACPADGRDPEHVPGCTAPPAPASGTPRSRSWGEGEVVLLFLGEVEAQHGVQTVEAGAEVVDLRRVQAAGGVGQLQVGGDAAGEAFDLGVRAA